MSTETANKGENPLRWWILLTVIIGTFLGRLDGTIVNLALPKIINDFSITVDQASYIATAYILANAIFVPIWGKLGDSIGRRLVYVLGFAIFIGGSVLAGLAWNLESMLVFRVCARSASAYTRRSGLLPPHAGRYAVSASSIWRGRPRSEGCSSRSSASYRVLVRAVSKRSRHKCVRNTW